MELLLGCGSSRVKQLFDDGRKEWSGLVTVDLEPRHRPDIVWDLERFPLPFEDGSADEIHIYQCLEHLGRQGDWRFFFAQFADFWRILKPGGRFFATVPAITSPWAWGDPSHTRVLPAESFYFLTQPHYDEVGRTAMSDFRSHYKADFDPELLEIEGHSLCIALRAVKPSRCKVT